MIIKSINEFFKKFESINSIELVEDFFIELKDDFDCEIDISLINPSVSGDPIGLISGAIGIVERELISPRLVSKVMSYIKRRVGLPTYSIHIEDVLPEDIELIKRYVEKTYIRLEFKYSFRDKLDIKVRIKNYLDRFIKSGYVKIGWDETPNSQIYYFLND